MLRHILLVYSLACINNVLGKPHQAENFGRDNASPSVSDTGATPQSSSSMWPGAASSATSLSSSISTSITRTITVVTTGIAGSMTIIEYPTTTDTAGDVSTVTSTLTNGENGTSTTAEGGATTTTQNPQPTSNSNSQWPSLSSTLLSPGSPLATTSTTSQTHARKHHSTRTISGGSIAQTMAIKPGDFEAALIIEENGLTDTVYVQVILSTLYNSPGTSPATTSSTDPNAGSQARSTTSTLASSSSGSTNANRMHKRGNREWKLASAFVTMTKGKSQPTN